jgi:hypothetical protein
MMRNWMATLDAFESHLDVQAELMENGRYDEVVEFTPPADLPAMPRPLVTRASELLDRARAMTDQAGAIRDEIGGKLAQSRRPVFAQHAVPVYIDQQA